MNNNTRRRLHWIALLATFVLAFLLSLPFIFKLPAVQKEVSAFLANNIRGTVTFEDASLTLFPRPAISLREVRFSLPDTADCTAPSVTLYPRLPSLFLGRFRIARINMDRPNAALMLPESPAPLPRSNFLAALRSQAPVYTDLLDAVSQGTLVLQIRDGALSLAQGGKPIAAFQNMTGRLSWSRPELSLNFSSTGDLWKNGTIAARISLEDFSGKGQLALTDFNAVQAMGALFPASSVQLEKGLLTTQATWETPDFETWRIGFSVEHPDLLFRKGNTTQAVKGTTAEGTLTFGKGPFQMKVTELDLAVPKARLTCGIHLDPALPPVGYDVNIHQADLADLGTAALFFAGEFATTRELVNILRGGALSNFHIGQKADTLPGLQDVTTLAIQGAIDQGTVYVPAPEDLLLTEASATVTVEKGTLTARGITTRLGNALGENGLYTMQLHGSGHTPFRVEGDVTADLSELPPLLSRLTRGSMLAREMDQIRGAKGTASGKMILDQKDGQLTVLVDVPAFHLSAGYARIPHPVTITKGEFHYRPEGVDVKNLEGAIGRTVFGGLSARIAWGETPTLSISSGQGTVHVGETAAWLAAYPALTAINTLQPAGNRIALSRIRFEGPLFNPAQWQFEVGGKISEPVSFLTPLFPEPLRISRGEFTATHSKLTLTRMEAAALDARLQGAGTWTGYLAGPARLDLKLGGTIGPDAGEWIIRQTAMPTSYHRRMPITISSLALLWEEKNRLDIAGLLSTETGLEVSINLHHAPDRLSAYNLAVRGKENQAEGGCTKDGEKLSLRFSGNLTQEMLHALPIKLPWISGATSGNFSTEIDLKNPGKFSATGTLQTEGIDLATAGLPLAIHQIDLKAATTVADIASARFSWAGTSFTAAGRVSQEGEKMVLDAALSSEFLDRDRVTALIKALIPPDRPTPSFLFGKVRITCDQFQLSPAVTFAPVEADLTLNGDHHELLIRKATACGISFPGKITVSPGQTRFDFQPEARGENLETAIACLRKGTTLMDGRFNLTGDIALLAGKETPAVDLLHGSATLSAEDGRIYRAVLLAKIFSILNITEIFSGRLPDLETSGFPYKTARFEGKFENGFFLVEKGVIDSQSMKLFFEGKLDLVHQTHQLTIVVAPFRTVDRIIAKVPLLKEVLSKGAVAYPVKVTGPWENPDVSLLSPTAVGSEVWGIVKRTLSLPATLLKKVIPKEKTPAP